MAYTELRKFYLDSLTRNDSLDAPEIHRLEASLERYTGAKHCIAVASAIDAITISLLSISLKPGDEVITTPLSCTKGTEAIVRVGAIPVFADINRSTCTVTVQRLCSGLDRIAGEGAL